MVETVDIDSGKSPRIAIVGGGISGLAAAHRLMEIVVPQSGLIPEIVVLEASNRAGGVISTVTSYDCLLELGPDSLITQKPWAIDLCRRLGLASQIVQTNERSRRTFVAFNGKLFPLPDGFMLLAPTKLWPFVTSPLFSWHGKMRMGCELVVPKKETPEDESLASFVVRRFGKEALERIAQPMIGGIYTADPERLSLRATMPRILELERKYGSVIAGMSTEARMAAQGKVRATRSESGARYGLFVALDKGMQLLVDTLVERLPEGSLRLNAQVKKIESGSASHRYQVILATGEVILADGVIIASPAHKAASIVSMLDGSLADDLSKISYASSAVLNLIYKIQDIPKGIDGFGFVVPDVEKASILACTFSSTKFPGRAPEGRTIVRVFLGGAMHQDIYQLDDESIEVAARSDLQKYLGIQAAPVAMSLTRHPSSMAQYHIGHLDLVKRIEECVKELPCFALCGNAYHGVGIADCVHSGELAAEFVLKALACHRA